MLCGLQEPTSALSRSFWGLRPSPPSSRGYAEATYENRQSLKDTRLPKREFLRRALRKLGFYGVRPVRVSDNLD